MSIFPKRVTRGENCIIQLRFSNSMQKTEIVDFKLTIYNPKNKIVLNESKCLILGGSEKEFVRQIYYPLHIKDSFTPGKYKVDFSLCCRGIKVNSQTEETDYLYVDNLNHYQRNKKIYIVNNSDEETPCSLLNEEGTEKSFIIKGKKSITVNSINDRNFIKYGNDRIEFINHEKDDIYYFRNPNVTCDNNTLKFADNKKLLK